MDMRILILLAGFLLSSPAFAFDEINTGYFNDTALQGYDSTHYFTAAQPLQGIEEFALSWNGAQWYFTDARSRDLFKADPDKYAPQYGGYCSNQMSLGNIADVDPGVWLIHSDKLYFFGHQAGKDRWQNTGIEARIKDADRYWQKYLLGN